MELAVLADDLTGGLIVASSLENLGVSCPVVTSVDAFQHTAADHEAVVLARKIRLVEPEDARLEAKLAAAAFMRVGAKRVFYKYSALFDSTPRGNIGPIAETLLQELGTEQTIFCPAFIDRDIMIFEGRMFLRNIPLAETAKRFDPVTPATNSNLLEVLQRQTKLPVRSLPHRILARGRAAAEEELKRHRTTPFFIADAVDAEDVRRLAELTLNWPLTTGADSLPPALARAWRKGQPSADLVKRVLPEAPGFSVVLAGSCSNPTLMQLDAFESARPVWRVNLTEHAEQPDLVGRIARWARDHLEDGPVAIATSGTRDLVEAAQARFGRDGAAERSDRIIGEVARQLFEEGVRKIRL